MKRIFVTKKEAGNILSNEQGVMVRLLISQPPEGYYLREISHGIAIFSDANLLIDIEVPLRYSSDEYVLYAPTKHYETNRQYPVTCLYDKEYTVPQKTDTKLTITTQVKRVSELTGNELNELAMYIDVPHYPEYDYEFDAEAKEDFIHKSFIPWWNAQHTRPSKTADGKGYECFPYELLEPNNINLKHCKIVAGFTAKDDFSLTYKGLPLTIYTADKTWIELNEVERSES